MDLPADGHRIHFSKTVSQTPIRLCGADRRKAVWIFHSSDQSIRIGPSGSIATNGVLLPSSQIPFIDDLSSEEWWAYYASGSGTVSGFVVF